MWEGGSQDTNESREKELSDKFFKPALEKGAQMIRHRSNVESAHDIVRKIMNNHPAALQIQRELVDERKAIIDTAAGGTLNDELQEQAERHKAELEEVRAEMREALKAKDKQLKQELEDARKDLEAKIEKIEEATKRMAANYAAEKEQMEAKMEEMEQEAKQHKGQAKAEYGRNSPTPAGRLRHAPNPSVADRAGLGVKKLQDRITIPLYK